MWTRIKASCSHRPRHFQWIPNDVYQNVCSAGAWSRPNAISSSVSGYRHKDAQTRWVIRGTWPVMKYPQRRISDNTLFALLRWIYCTRNGEWYAVSGTYDTSKYSKEYLILRLLFWIFVESFNKKLLLFCFIKVFIKKTAI